VARETDGPFLMFAYPAIHPEQLEDVALPALNPIIGTIGLPKPPNNAPATGIVCLVIGLARGTVTGPHEVTLEAVPESGVFVEMEPVPTFTFSAPVAVMPARVQVSRAVAGTTWLRLLVNGRVMTRIPLAIELVDATKAQAGTVQ